MEIWKNAFFLEKRGLVCYDVFRIALRCAWDSGVSSQHQYKRSLGSGCGLYALTASSVRRMLGVALVLEHTPSRSGARDTKSNQEGTTVLSRGSETPSSHGNRGVLLFKTNEGVLDGKHDCF